MDWVDYLKIKYRFKGRGWQYGDCFNLLLRFYERELGIVLPDYHDYPEGPEQRAEELFLKLYHDWGFTPVEQPRFGDVALLKLGHYVCHCAVVIDARRGELLQCGRQGTTTCNYLTDAQWRRRLYGFYRHEDLVC